MLTCAHSNDATHSFRYNAKVSAHDMRETYLAGWKAAGAAGIQGAMCSSNAVNGIPLCAHRDLLTAVLKKEFGMSGATLMTHSHFFLVNSIIIEF